MDFLKEEAGGGGVDNFNFRVLTLELEELRSGFESASSKALTDDFFLEAM